MRVAVVGSGVASITAVRTLCGGDADIKVDWFTARRKMGATQSAEAKSPTARPAPGRPYFDYGCQYMSPYSQPFAQELERWKNIGAATDDFPASILDGGAWRRLETPGHVGRGGMGPMLETLTLQTAEEFGKQGLKHVSGFPEVEQQAVGLVRDEIDHRWYLNTKKKQRAFGPFDYVIGAFGHPKRTDPFLQTAGPHTLPLKNFLKGVRYNQFFALQLVLDDVPAADSNLRELHACHVVNDEVLSFIADNSKKPHSIADHPDERRRTPKPYLTLISTAQFAQRGAKTDRKQIQTRMLSSLAKLLAGTSLPAFQQAYRPRVHRLNFWQDGRPTNLVVEKDSAEGAGCLWDPTIQLAWCGEFCVAPCVDGAAQSGAAAGKEVLNHILERRGSSSLIPGGAAGNPRQNHGQNHPHERYRWIDADEALGDGAGGMVDIGYFGHLGDDTAIKKQRSALTNPKTGAQVPKRRDQRRDTPAQSKSRTGNKSRRKRNGPTPGKRENQKDGSQNPIS